MDIDQFRKRILFEDNHLIIVNKMAGEIVQGDKTGDESLLDTIKDYIKLSCNKPGNVFAGLVHRIDRPVSGAVIYTRTGKALSRITEQLKQHKIIKSYWAVVASVPDPVEAELEHFLLRNEKSNKTNIVRQQVHGAKHARLDYRLLSSAERYHLLAVRLHTGRHHQIRAQLSAIGCPIAGDLKYGAKRSNPDGSIGLHARSLEFDHPVGGKRILIVAPTPQIFPWYLFDGL